MIQLTVFSGVQGRVNVPASQFPFRVGRNRDANCCLEEDGVWDNHLEFDMQWPDGCRLKVLPSALATLNGEPVKAAMLRSGDLIEIGRVKIQFWLAEVRQKSLVLRELLTWVFVAALCIGQIVLIHALLP